MMIRLNDVSYSYEQKQVLQHINLGIPEGKLIVLCGVTGSGKSTLLRLLSGLAEPDSGRISYAQGEGGSLSSLVFQQPETQLFASSAEKDVEYGLDQRNIPRPQRPEMIRSALEQVGLPYADFRGRSPFLLSGGEKRRLCIAGAIASPPEVLLLDEPTAGLDPSAVRGLLDTLQELRRSGLTLVVGTHDLDSFFPIADEVIVMSQGTVHYQGPVGPLIASPDKLAAAGLEIPGYARIGRKLMALGRLSSVPDSPGSLLDKLKSQSFPVPERTGSEAVEGNSGKEDAVYIPGGDVERNSDAEQLRTTSGRRNPLWQLLDPRVKWLGMVLWSIVILGMNTPLPLLLAAALISILIRSAGITWRRTVQFFRPFIFMFLFLWMVSAVSFQSGDWRVGPVGISYSGAVQGGYSVLRFLLVVALGFLFTETTTGAPLREALEWAIAPLKRLGIRTRNWSLAVSVTLQFVPWILRKISQLQLALRSRGRRNNPIKRWTPKQISMLMVPLLILVIGMGDELATAIESRGYDPRKERTPWFILVWRQSDTLALAFVLLTAVVLWLMS
jgi:energy-coupling factor transport system permease/ATP-binding protein